LIAEYENEANPDKLLALKVAAIALNVHNQWVPMVPNPDHLKVSAGPATPPATK
jgi:hypothetical protein